MFAQIHHVWKPKLKGFAKIVVRSWFALLFELEILSASD